MLRADPRLVAARLGFDEPTIRRLDARGHLGRLTRTESEIRRRLYQAHLAHLCSPTSAPTWKEES
jgi:hypothetical protein